MNFTFSKKTIPQREPGIAYSHLSLKNYNLPSLPTTSVIRSRPAFGNLYANMYDLHSQTQSCSSCGK